MQIKTFLIAIICLVVGFISAYFFISSNTSEIGDDLSTIDSKNVQQVSGSLANPFSVKASGSADDIRLNNIENEIDVIKQQLQQIEQTLQDLAASETAMSASSRPAFVNNSPFTSALNQRLYDIDNLIKGGIDPALAEDIVRRKNGVELKRLELQDRATRDDFLNTQQYYDELAEINKQDINLRDELGDDQYDQYLYNSKQNNRIRITSVMLESAAEKAGIQSGDIVLSYDNRRMFLWQELKDATAEGQLGEYVSMSIYRNGQIYSFSVPRGPLGIQLGATRLEP
jgi:C-terminal processing protease CtpA/Prc